MVNPQEVWAKFNAVYEEIAALRAALDAATLREKRMREAFRNTDDMDWDFLLSKLGDGGRERYWKTVIGEIRQTLKDTSNG